MRRSRSVRGPGLWWWPLRLAYGLFFLHTATAKLALDEKGTKGLHGFAAAAYPQLRAVSPTTFVRGMIAAESTIAASLLVPVVPAAVGGAGLAAFGTGLLGTYVRIPGMRRPGSIRPTEPGLGLAKDVWMVAAGVAVLTDRITAARQ